MKTENKKPRVKMNYQVSEIHHLFFNQALPNGAKAGAHATYDNGALYHEPGQPAAAFLNDACGADNKPAAVIFPATHNGRWGVCQLEGAAPASVHAITIKRGTGAGKYTDNARSYLFYDGKGPRRFQSAAILCAAYTAAIVYDCQRAAHSAQDSAGDRPVDLPYYVDTCRALLALDWTDKAAHEYARAELEKVINYWQLGPAGQYDHGIISAISQREKVTQAAAAALPKVRAYFSAREKLLGDKTPAGYRARVRHFNGRADSLTNEIRDILRADLPAALLVGLPQNIAGTVMADTKKASRAAEYLSAPAYVANYWKTGRLNVDRNLLPLWARLSIEQAMEAGINARRRAEAKETIKQGRRAIAALNEVAPAVMAAAATIEASAPDQELIKTAVELKYFQAAANARQSAALIRQAAELSGGKDPFYVWPLAITTDQLQEAAGAVSRAGREYAERARWAEKVEEKRGEIAEHLAGVYTKPRAAANGLDYLRMQVNGYGYYWNNAPNDLKKELLAEIVAALDLARANFENVSELAEYENGGAAPTSGDWLLIKNGTATTSRGARVPARAIKAALAFIDRQAAGAFDCRENNIQLGAFQLIGRNESGAIIVGCHTFSAASVEHIRAQLAAEAVAA